MFVGLELMCSIGYHHPPGGRRWAMESKEPIDRPLTMTNTANERLWWAEDNKRGRARQSKGRAKATQCAQSTDRANEANLGGGNMRRVETARGCHGTDGRQTLPSEESGGMGGGGSNRSMGGIMCKHQTLVICAFGCNSDSKK